MRGGRGVRIDPIVASLEYRDDRPYDEQSPGHLLMPNGSSLDSNDRHFLTVAAPHVLALWSDVYGVPVYRCARSECGMPIHYQRAAHASGGDSAWVHSATGDPVCDDRKGRCERPNDLKGAAA